MSSLSDVEWPDEHNPEFLAGKEAGWRRDELVTPKTEAYLLGYEMGQTERQEVNRKW